MRIRIAIAILLIMTIPLAAQRRSRAVEHVTFIHEIADKEYVTFGDAVSFFVLILGKEQESLFSKNVDILKAAGITRGLDYAENTTARKGMIAALIADYLKLGDSLFYLIFRTERYAFRACIAHGIMDYDASEWDRVSGGELIEIMSKVSERASGGKK